MNCKLLWLTFSLVFGIIVSNAQNLTVTSAQGQNPQALINNHLAGDGVILTNGSFNNSAGNIATPQIGTFNRGGFTTFPFASGIIMTTGNVSVAVGPNTLGSASEPISNFYTDPLLNPLATSSLNACAALDFDFVAFSDTFAFNYSFASEEYPEYVCSSFNDVFAFFLTGIDPVTFTTTTKNVAIIPNTITAANPSGLPVTINSVNPGSPGASGGGGTGCYYSYSQYYHANGSGPGTQYDGYTVNLTAQAVILACQTYHMHLSIGNVGDNAYDSGVFLEEGSFYSPTMNIESRYNIPNHGDTLVQNCREADVTFELPRAVLTGNYHSEFAFGGDAIINQDYELTYDGNTMGGAGEANNFTFPQDSSIIRAHIRVLPDASFNDGQVKEAILYITTIFCQDYYEQDYPGSYRIDTLHYYLVGNAPIHLTDTTIKACHVANTLSISHSSGTEPLIYSWSPVTGLTDFNHNPATGEIDQNRIFTVIARDRFGCLADTGQVTVKIFELPDARISVYPEYGCSPLPVSFSAGSIPNECEVVWTLTHDTLTWNLDSTATTNALLTDPGYYNVNLWLSTAPGCSDSLSISNSVHVSDYPHAAFTFSPDEPQNGQEVNFYNGSEGQGALNYLWYFGDGNSSEESDPVHAYHLENSDIMMVRLQVSNHDGCSDDTTITVPIVDNFAFYVPNAFTPNHDGTNEVFHPRVSSVATYRFDIFTRTGELIFSTTDLEEGWDGTLNGKLAPMGVYVWKIQYSKYSSPKKTIVKTGNLNLIR